MALILSKSVGKLVSPQTRWPSVDALCPFGGVETLWKLVTTGNYLQKLHPSNIVLGIGLLAAVLLAGGTFCGWICPFGTLQDWLTALRRRLGLRELKIPPALARPLGYLRYAVLGIVIYYTATIGRLVFESYDPYRTLFSLSWLSEPSLSAWPAYIITITVIAGSFAIERFWCRFLCPLGAIIGLMQPLSLVKIRRSPTACRQCNVCARVCPMKIDVGKRNTPGAACIGCLQCLGKCPFPGALAVVAGPGRGLSPAELQPKLTPAGGRTK